MGEYQWSGSADRDLGNEGNWFSLDGGPIAEPGPDDVAIIEFGQGLTGTLNVGALDLVQQGSGEPALSIAGASTQVTAASAGIANSFTLESGALLQTGTLSTAAGSSIFVTGAGTDVDGGDVALAGSVELDKGATMQAAMLSIAGSSAVAVQSGSTLDATVSTSNTMTVGSSAGSASLLVTGRATFNCMSYDTEGDLNIGGANGSHATLTISGQASMIASPDNLVIGADESSNGLLSVIGAGSSAIFECWGIVFVGPAPGGAGTVSVSGGGYLMLDSVFGVVDITSDTSAKVIVSGAGSELDAGPSVEVGGTTVYDVAGKGEILVQNGGLFRAFDHTNLQTRGTIAVTGAGSVFETSQMQIMSQASLRVGSFGSVQVATCTLDGGTIQLTGGTLAAVVDYAAQSGTLTGAGTLTAPRIVNAGLLDAKGGTLRVIGKVIGTGAMHIETGSTLQLDNSVAASQTLAFRSGGNTLSLADAHDFAGRIVDFAAGDAIDLLRTAATSLSFVKGALSVLDGSATIATLHVAGSYAGAGFHLAADGHGGEVISYVTTAALGGPVQNWACLDHYQA